MDTKEFGFPKEVLDGTDVLCLFGFDPEEARSKLASWSDSGDKQIMFVRTKNSHDLESFVEISKKRVFQKFSYLVAPGLKEPEKADMEWLAAQYQAVEWHTHLVASDYRDLGVKVFHNLCANYTRKADLKTFPMLKDSLKGIPAFICGAGASLETAIPYLEKIQDKGAIFAGGAALGCLSFFSVPIHIAAGIDPDPSYDRCLMQGSFEAPFFYQSRFSSKLLDLVQGPLFQVPSHSGLRLEEQMIEFDGGCTVTTFCSALALHLGCSPIVFVGMDLAYVNENTKYAQKISGEAKVSSHVVYEEKITQKDWVIAAKWLENLIATHSHVSFYTTSEVGLSLEGAHKTSFSHLLESVQLPSYDIDGKIHFLKTLGDVSEDFLQDRLEKVEQIEKSLTHSLECVERILLLFQHAYPEDPSSQGEFILHLFALYNEIVYQHLLEPIWKVWRFPLERTLSNDYEKNLHQWLFFKRVLESHLLFFDKERYAKREI